MAWKERREEEAGEETSVVFIPAAAVAVGAVGVDAGTAVAVVLVLSPVESLQLGRQARMRMSRTRQSLPPL